MNEPRTCPSCHQAIPADAPGGACPRCLIGVGLGSGSGVTDGAAAVPDVSPDEVRRRFPAYEVVAPLGRGGMGVVFRAKQRALDRDVALKVLPASASRPAGFAERFEREAKALARLQHPGIVQVFDFGTSPDGWCYLAMELVDGTNLRRALAGGRLAPKEALAIVPQICDALQYAHDQGVVHRDIKPENVLLTKDGRVKIADFGLAKLVADVSGGPEASWVTRTGLTMGTPLYMAPEQIEHPLDVDHRADIYSLGVVFYEMLTGELPLGRFASPSRKCDVDARIDEIVFRTLEKEREARYQRAADVRTEMDAAAAGTAPRRTARAGWRTWILGEPATADARISRLALAAALFPLAAGLGTWIVWAASEGRPMTARVPETSAAANFGVFAGMLLALVAWIRIRLSKGRLRHGVLCLVGLVGSAFAGPIAQSSTAGSYAANQAYLHELNPALYPGIASQVQRSGSSSQPNVVGGARDTAPNGLPIGASLPNGWPIGQQPRPAPRIVDGIEIAPGVHDTLVAEAVHGPAIRGLFGLAQALWPPKEWEEFEKLYGMGDANVLKGLDEKARAERGADGVLGLPLATEAFLGGSLRSARVTKVTVEFGRTRGWITFFSGRTAFVADVVREPGTLAAMPWRFALTPVRKATDQPLLAEEMAPPATQGGTRR